MVASPQPSDLASQLTQLRNEIEAIRRVASNAGTTSNTYSPHSDGSPQRVPLMTDEQGNWRAAIWDPNTPSTQATQQWWMWDHLGNQFLTGDKNGGWATPWLQVPMYPRFQAATSVTPSTTGTPYGYASISTSASGMAQNQLLWEGRIPYVSHPRISVDGVWGPASGTVVPTYTLKVSGSSVGTWSYTTLTTGAQPVAPINSWDISSLLGRTQIQVQITVAWTSTGVIAADVLGVYLRQT